MYKIGLVYNKPKEMTEEEMALDPRSYRQNEIIANDIKEAFETKGHEVKLIPASTSLLYEIKEAGEFDVIFNSAVGINNKNEQANISGMLELLDIPFVGSGLLPQVISLNKEHAKATFKASGVPVSPFQVFYSADTPLDSDLSFPLFVKPVREGSAVGITADSMVNNEEELRKQISYVLDNFKQPALVEGYLIGREFSVAVLGTENPKTLPIMEVIIPQEFGTTQTVDVKANNVVTRSCPADISSELADEISQTVLRAYKALGCTELARVDVKLDDDGAPNVIELNAIPALEAGYAHYPLMAEEAGYDMPSLVEKLVEEAIYASESGRISFTKSCGLK
ncbi:D-alanine--D-alanine ligase [Alkalibacterium sp. m-11]|uniref:D-alanine--D-alanine ligase n=1 Tax=Alkalibacterium indicireducens TaxID=398758 RepID=A0ABP3L190_9LACT